MEKGKTREAQSVDMEKRARPDEAGMVAVADQASGMTIRVHG